jgi:hypothetical protein
MTTPPSLGLARLWCPTLAYDPAAGGTNGERRGEELVQFTLS